MSSPTPSSAIVKRTYPHGREHVFAAFADARLLEQWFSPGEEVKTEVLHFDFQTGGRYRIAFFLPDGTSTTVGGVFHRIEPPAHLSFEWTWEKPDMHAGIRTFVTVEFVQKNGATTVVVTHEKLADEDMKDRHAAGWDGALERLRTWLLPRDTQQEKE